MKYQMTMFMMGICYFFGFSTNPADSILRYFNEKSDMDRIAGDWQKIGLDIKKAYEVGQKAIS
ncbi:MAG: hypothetical protein LBN98_05305 [Prevotellaceae bacterium]|jgi:hypothetical protein|nr:hypothetical protein [Prevotellaceae bacterium]